MSGSTVYYYLFFGQLITNDLPRAMPKHSQEAKEYQAKRCIYRYDSDGTLSVAQQGRVMAGNGLCWSPDNTKSYFVDSYINVKVPCLSSCVRSIMLTLR